MKEIPLTSLSLFEFTCSKDLTQSVHSEIKKLDLEKKIEWKRPQDTGDNHSLFGLMSQEKKQFYYHQELFEWFQNCINEVSKTVLKKRLSIVDAWLTKTNFLNYVRPHQHRFSVLSGVFYFQPTKNSNIRFYHRNPLIEKFDYFYYPIEIGSDNRKIHDAYADSTVYHPDEGKLIIFPSFLYHSIDVNNDIKETRYSLAFNTYFTGDISTFPTGWLSLKPLDINEMRNKTVF